MSFTRQPYLNNAGSSSLRKAMFKVTPSCSNLLLSFSIIEVNFPRCFAKVMLAESLPCEKAHSKFRTYTEPFKLHCKNAFSYSDILFRLIIGYNRFN